MLVALRRSERERFALPREPIRTRSRTAPRAAHGPELVGEMLLERRDLGLDRDARCRCRLRSRPRGSARPPVSTHALRFWYMRPRVPSIGSTMKPPGRLDRAGLRGSTTLSAGNALGHEHECRRSPRARASSSRREQRLAHPVDGVDGVAGPVVRDVARAPPASRSLARLDHRVANRALQAEQRACEQMFAASFMTAALR